MGITSVLPDSPLSELASDYPRMHAPLTRPHVPGSLEAGWHRPSHPHTAGINVKTTKLTRQSNKYLHDTRSEEEDDRDSWWCGAHLDRPRRLGMKHQCHGWKGRSSPQLPSPADDCYPTLPCYACTSKSSIKAKTRSQDYWPVKSACDENHDSPTYPDKPPVQSHGNYKTCCQAALAYNPTVPCSIGRIGVRINLMHQASHFSSTSKSGRLRLVDLPTWSQVRTSAALITGGGGLNAEIKSGESCTQF